MDKPVYSFPAEHGTSFVITIGNDEVIHMGVRIPDHLMVKIPERHVRFTYHDAEKLCGILRKMFVDHRGSEWSVKMQSETGQMIAIKYANTNPSRPDLGNFEFNLDGMYISLDAYTTYRVLQMIEDLNAYTVVAPVMKS